MVHTGKLHIKEQTGADESNAPFAGYTANIEAYTETQWLTMRPEIAPVSVLGPGRS